MFQSSQQIKVVCSCVRTLVHFAGFYRQPLSGLLRGFLCLEVCISRSASGIELKITTFRKSLLYFFCFELCSFFHGRQEIFLHSALLVSTDHSHSISRHRPCKSSTCVNFFASSHAFIAKAGIACEHWCPYIKRHRAPLCVLLTHVRKRASV